MGASSNLKLVALPCNGAAGLGAASTWSLPKMKRGSAVTGASGATWAWAANGANAARAKHNRLDTTNGILSCMFGFVILLVAANPPCGTVRCVGADVRALRPWLVAAWPNGQAVQHHQREVRHRQRPTQGEARG